MVDKSIRHSMTSLYKTVYFKKILVEKIVNAWVQFHRIANRKKQYSIKCQNDYSFGSKLSNARSK